MNNIFEIINSKIDGPKRHFIKKKVDDFVSKASFVFIKSKRSELEYIFEY